MLVHPNIDPVAFHLGPLAIRWYGISYVAGLALAWWLLDRRARRPEYGWTADEVGDVIFYGAVGVILGGRIGYVLFYNLPVFATDPLGILRIWQGGMSFHGGLLGVIVALLVLARRQRRPFFALADYVVPAVPVGLFCGRLANFVNGELWGRPTDLPWGVVFPAAEAGGLPRHPTQLYEAGLEGALLFGVLWFATRRPLPLRVPSGLFFIGYGVLRALVEFVREPDAHLGYLAYGWLTMGQVLCLPMIAAGAWMLATARPYPAPATRGGAA